MSDANDLPPPGPLPTRAPEPPPAPAPAVTAEVVAVPAFRFFQAQGANRWPELFTPQDVIGGVLWGFAATDDPAKLAAIEALMAEPRPKVSEISEEDYVKAMQKKTQVSAVSGNWRPPPVPSSASPASLAGNKPGEFLPGPKVFTTVPPKPAVVVSASAPGTPAAPVAPGALKGGGTATVQPEGLAASGADAIEPGKPVPSVAEVLSNTGEVDPPPSAKPKNSQRKK